MLSVLAATLVLGASQHDTVIGIGGTHAPYEARFEAREKAEGTAALERALAWLASQQAEDGSWSTTDASEPGSAPMNDVGLTGLALLAFLGDGNTTRTGPHKDTVVAGVKWLRANVDPDTGRLGEKKGVTHIYNHAIATQALAEAYHFSKSPLLKHSAQKAVDYLLAARNPYGGWRYSAPPDGDTDTSVTAWATWALHTARTASLKIEPAAFDSALAWIDEMTAPNGRIGYDARGSVSARIPGVNDHIPTELGEAMTAAGLTIRLLVGRESSHEEVLERHADLLLRKLPEWDPERFGGDMYYWLFGSFAMHEMGGTHQTAWQTTLERAALAGQVAAGNDEAGSWDPIGPWGRTGGRVYATALMALCLEAPFRF